MMDFYTANGGQMPKHATTKSVGADLVSTEDAWIFPFCRKVLGTGVFVVQSDQATDFPMLGEAVEAQVRSRSGMAAKRGLFVLNSPGTIEQDYKDEIKVILANFSFLPRRIKAGDRIAQIVVSETHQAFPVKNIYRQGGLGSTGTGSSK